MRRRASSLPLDRSRLRGFVLTTVLGSWASRWRRCPAWHLGAGGAGV